jgi:hypothetical protein
VVDIKYKKGINPTKPPHFCDVEANRDEAAASEALSASQRRYSRKYLSLEWRVKYQKISFSQLEIGMCRRAVEISQKRPFHAFAVRFDVRATNCFQTQSQSLRSR